MRPRDLLAAALVVVCAMLGSLWPVASASPVTSTDGPQFLEWCRDSGQC